jgi:hypothetical protein
MREPACPHGGAQYMDGRRDHQKGFTAKPPGGMAQSAFVDKKGKQYGEKHDPEDAVRGLSADPPKQNGEEADQTHADSVCPKDLGLQKVRQAPEAHGVAQGKRFED